ncbi:unnamed protein product [Vitrella brassicaformis CCMP3155]|uniref:Uncharacterized protein n=1 Tax=Vitrella brassicaformis (strain CCMP3155) TaxID=1169540 RepID=A0A0G4E9D0_VITBC|nr:unnamed protein product [Vitrella brassicaformis CCMP3155]|eukprot:CEL91848.1 unnamed protein product [Vitrella brassicaformis CCMP3155]
MCAVFNFADEGVKGAIDSLNGLKDDLTPTGQLITDINTILDNTLDFTQTKDSLIGRLSHMQTTLESNALIVSAEQHKCLFCEEAASLISSSLADLESGITKALADVREIVDNNLGQNSSTLTDINSALDDAMEPLEDAEKSFNDVVTDILVDQREMVDQRRLQMGAGLITVSVVFTVIAFVGIGALLLAKCSNKKFPIAMPQCCVWCCFALCSSIVLIVAGFLLFLSVALGSVCNFVREDLLTTEGWNTYGTGDTLKLDNQTLDIMITCLTPAGSGDLMEALNLTGDLDFEEQIDQKFDELAAQQNQSVDLTEVDTLVTFSQQFGWLMLTDENVFDSTYPTYDLVKGVGIQNVNGTITDADALAALPSPSGGISFDVVPGLSTLERVNRDLLNEVLNPNPFVPDSLKYDKFFYMDVMHPSGIPSQFNNSEGNAADYRITRSFDHTNANPLVSNILGYFPAADATDFQNMLFWMRTKAGVTLDTQVSDATDELNVQLRALLDDTLDKVSDLLDAINCKFIYRGMNGMLEGLCGEVVPSLMLISMCWCVSGFLGIILMFMMYAAWSFTIDTKLLSSSL